MRTELQKQKRRELSYKKRHPCIACANLIGERSIRCRSCGLKNAYQQGKMRHKIAKKPCPQCGKPIWPKASYCRSCAGLFRKERHPNWKGGRITKAGYIKVLIHEHPRADYRGYVFEHIIIWEKTHNKTLPANWIIHHLNGIRNDNRPENLMALPDKKHKHILEAKAKRIQQLEALLQQQQQLI